MGDTFTMVVILFVLVMVGYTIYSYLQGGRYSHYALVISIVSCIGLLFLTRKSESERQLAATASVFGNLGPKHTPRILAYGGKKRK